MIGSPAESSMEEERRVLVTGGNGFIGSWIVRILLARGYAVTATYQPGTDAVHLLALDDERLLLLPADLLDAGAISAAAAAGGGCRAGVLHVASPCTLADPRDPQAELVEPAVRGTLHVLEAARGGDVVHLSHGAQPRLGGGRARRRAKLDGHGILQGPGQVVPGVQDAGREGGVGVRGAVARLRVGDHPAVDMPRPAPAAHPERQLCRAAAPLAGVHGAVHVRDVAAAHLLLLEAPTVSGRYLCTNGIYQFSDFARLATRICPAYAHAIHRFEEGSTQPWLVPRDGRDAARRLLDLGLVLTPLEEAIKDAEKSLTDKCFLP